ncbi:hypothetical protein LOK49_LG02G00316 [Camellia lanceoleosa]|uniref:Uncharacterized protein n=1 Tax=Camellia lanceoleosa TaxID=1840588 RepID=A0ACC0IRK1_9ERIC|nr:hypothetical protein LOK49_LG02G00316 [Camellia lanceoleosa]
MNFPSLKTSIEPPLKTLVEEEFRLPRSEQRLYPRSEHRDDRTTVMAWLSAMIAPPSGLSCSALLSNGSPLQSTSMVMMMSNSWDEIFWF